MPSDHHIVCPRCAAVNRVPEARLSGNPVCGKCRQALFSGAPVALTDDSFPVHVGRSSVPVVVDFWAPWCAPCRAMAPQFERAAALLEPAVRLAKLDTEANPATAGRYAVRSIPTLILFSEGRELARRSGAMDAGTLAGWVRDSTRA
jgi:thioredoxin 2